MNNIQWTDNLKTGIKEIDSQHLRLYKYISDLYEECSLEKELDPENVKLNISKIRTFAVKHFHSEERLMREFNYPYYQEHRIKHKELLEELMKYKVKAGHYELDKLTLLKFAKFISDWFTSQTLVDDLKFANFLKYEVGFGKKLILKIKEFF